MSSTLSTNRNIESLIGQMEETFSQRLLRLIDERGMTDSEAYNKAYVDTARRRLLWSSTTVTLPHGSGRSGRTADQPKKKGLHRPKRKVFVTSSGGYRQKADKEASQSENPTTEKDSFNAENNTAGQYPCLAGLHTF